MRSWISALDWWSFCEIISKTSTTHVSSSWLSFLSWSRFVFVRFSYQHPYHNWCVLNCAADVIFGGDRRDHVTPLLRDKLHWLRAKEQITFKLCLLVCKAINGLAPSYLRDLCVPVTTAYTRSSLVVPRTRRRLGNRAFCIAGPTDLRRGTACSQTLELLRL